MWKTKYALAVPKNLGLGLNFQPCSAQRLRRVKLIIRRFCFSKLPWVISECPAPFVDANIAQGWLQTRLNTGTLVLFCQF